LLFALGLDDEIIGITTFCIHPAEKVLTKTKVGGTKKLDIAFIRQLKPDLVIANKEENDRSQVEEIMSFCPVWISDIENVQQALQMISAVGEITGRTAVARQLNEEISKRFNALPIPATGLTTAYLIWRKPYMVAGKRTFIDHMLQTCGLTNVFSANRYPEVSLQQLADAKPDVVLLSSEPYPFKQKHLDELKAVLPDSILKLVDGELFSWYGSRMLLAPEYFKALADSIQGIKTSNNFY
jgi:ABC-type Fe3+-hydroxamate transport system substrate-binding protein